MRADIVPGGAFPDWDLAAPGLRENWGAGDHTMHHSYQPSDHVTERPLPFGNN